MRTVFLDTAGVLAVLDVRDQWHAAAENAYRTLLRGNAIMVTSPYVLLELGNAASRKPYRLMIAQIRSTLLRQERVIAPTDKEVEDAWDVYARRQPGDAGIVDLVSISIMRRMEITDILTNDQHFAAVGFHTLY